MAGEVWEGEKYRGVAVRAFGGAPGPVVEGPARAAGGARRALDPTFSDSDGPTARTATGVAQEAFEAIVETAQEGICTIDAAGRVIFANRRMADLVGREYGTLEGMALTALLGRHVGEVLENRSAPARAEIRTPRPDGTLADAIVSVTPLMGSGDGATSLVMVVDVTRLRRTEEELARAALYDTLTGLPNRTLFIDRVDQTLRRATRQEPAVAVLALDLDCFEVINDSLGHDAGDRVLEIIAERLL